MKSISIGTELFLALSEEEMIIYHTKHDNKLQTTYWHHSSKQRANKAHPVIQDTVEEEYCEAGQAVEDGKEVLVDNKRLVDRQQTKHPGDA